MSTDLSSPWLFCEVCHCSPCGCGPVPSSVPRVFSEDELRRIIREELARARVKPV